MISSLKLTMNLKAFGDLQSCENVSSNAVAVEMKEVFLMLFRQTSALNESLLRLYKVFLFMPMCVWINHVPRG